MRKTEGTGLLNDKGEVVREVKGRPKKFLERAGMLTYTYKCLNCSRDLFSDDNHFTCDACGHITSAFPGALDPLTNYQNDGMGCPGRIPSKQEEELLELCKQLEIKPTKLYFGVAEIDRELKKTTKFKRVK